MSLRASILLSMIFLLVIGCKTDSRLYKMSITPGPELASQLDPSGRAITFEENGIWGALVPLPFESLDTPSDVDPRWTFENPFKGLYPKYEEPISFYLIIENRTDGAITFNPSGSFSLLLEGWPLFSIEYDDLYQSLYDMRGSSHRLDAMKKMLLNSYISLQPGEHARGLLLFKRPEPGARKAKELDFRIRQIYVGTKDVDFLLPLRLTMEKVVLPTP